MSSNLKPDTKEKQATQMPITEETKSNVITKTNPITLNAAKADTIDKAKAEKTDEFIKNLFQIVQGVKYDDRCPHGLPYYACMSCSH